MLVVEPPLAPSSSSTFFVLVGLADSARIAALVLAHTDCSLGMACSSVITLGPIFSGSGAVGRHHISPIDTL